MRRTAAILNLLVFGVERTDSCHLCPPSSWVRNGEGQGCVDEGRAEQGKGGEGRVG